MQTRKNSETPTPGEEYTGLFTGRLNIVMDLSLVLASQHIMHRISFHSPDYILEVNPWDREKAQKLLSLYLKENKDWKTELESTGDLRLSPAPFLFLAVPALVYFFQATVYNPTRLVYAGRCDAHEILSGEWWRVFTGLTLHAGPQHFISNLLAGYFIINLLVNRINTGLAMIITTILAGLANFLVALQSPAGHLSLGFSTAVFASLGFLSSIQAWHNYRQKIRSQKTWAPIIAAFFMVILLGLGEGADIRAHFFGFLTGIIGGITYSPLERLTRKFWIQASLVGMTYGIFSLCWYLALYSLR
jgi:membrane associated rhomboid family serine protease